MRNDLKLALDFREIVTDHLNTENECYENNEKDRMIFGKESDDKLFLGRRHGNDIYVTRFYAKDATYILHQFGKWARDPDLTFTWYDAAVLSQKMRELLPERNN